MCRETPAISSCCAVLAVELISVRMSRSSTSSPIIISLSTYVTGMYRFAGPILITVGTVSSVITIVLFVRKNFHQYPSSIYVVARNMSNLGFIYFAIFYETLAIGYNITPDESNLVYCRLSTFTALLFDVLSPFYLLLTLIDRQLSTSCEASTRARCTHRLAYMLSIGGFLFWALLHLHTPFFAEIVRTEGNFVYCYFEVGSYSTLMLAYTLAVKGLLAPVAFLILGWRMVDTYRKRCQLVSISSVSVVEKISSSLVRTRDREIVIVLAKDIVVYILFSSISSIIFLYELITQHHVKDVARIQLEHYIRYMGIFCVSVPFCVSFYTNMLLSKTFRREVKQLIDCRPRRG